MTSDSFHNEDLSRNAFLGGAIHVLQPQKGYRAGIDPVLLAASISAKPRQSVLELGCGSGIASLCLAARVTGLEIAGVEIQPEYANLARRNAKENHHLIEIVTASIHELPASIKARRFDHVMANPPYFDNSQGTEAADAGRAKGRAGADIASWVHAAAKRVSPKGWVSFVQAADNMPSLISAFSNEFKRIEVLPIVSRTGRAAKLVIVRGCKSGTAGCILHSPLVMHDGDKHTHDGDDYSKIATDILRRGAEISWGH